jgi:hypothetical protein
MYMSTQFLQSLILSGQFLNQRPLLVIHQTEFRYKIPLKLIIPILRADEYPALRTLIQPSVKEPDQHFVQPRHLIRLRR